MKKYKVLWTEIALKDLDEIIGYIALRDTIINAKKIYLKIKKSASDLTIFPYRGRVVPELKQHNISAYREIILSPWRIIYRVEKNLVYVMSVFDGRRDIEDILLSRILKE